MLSYTLKVKIFILLLSYYFIFKSYLMQSACVYKCISAGIILKNSFLFQV